MPSAWRRRRSRRPPSSTWCASTPFPTSCRRSAPRTALPGPFGREGCSGSRTPAAAASSTASIGRGPPPSATISCRPPGAWIAPCAGAGSGEVRSREAPPASLRNHLLPAPRVLDRLLRGAGLGEVEIEDGADRFLARAVHPAPVFAGPPVDRHA